MQGMKHLYSEILEQYRQCFSLFDSDGDGVVKLVEIEKILRSLGLDGVEDKALRLFKEFDLSKDNSIDEEEFLHEAVKKFKTIEFEDELATLFAQFDEDDNGYLSAHELQSLAVSIGAPLNDEYIQTMLKDADLNNDGRIHEHEFRRVLLAKSSLQYLDAFPETEMRISEIIDTEKFKDSLLSVALTHPAVHHPYLQGLADGLFPDITSRLREMATEFRAYNLSHSVLLRSIASQLSEKHHIEALNSCLQEEAGILDQDDLNKLIINHIDPDWVQGIPHPELFERFCQAMGVDFEQSSGIGHEFNDKLEKICQRSIEDALGALAFGIEAVVPSIYAYIVRAIEDATDLKKQEYVFFPLHQYVDDSHADMIASIAMSFATSHSARERVRRGMLDALSAREQFWDQLHALVPSVDIEPTNEKTVSTKSLYDQTAKHWARTEPLCLSDFTAREPLFTTIGNLDGKRVLDVGCGEGYCTRRYMSMGAKEVVGLDFSEEQIRVACAKEEEELLGISYVAGNALELRSLLQRQSLYRDENGQAGFDVITAVFLFNYSTLNEMERILKQIHSLLRPGGCFYFTVPHPSLPFWKRTHDSLFAFHLDDMSKRKGYFDGIDRQFPGTIARKDGQRLDVQLRHKTFANILQVLKLSEFSSMPDLQELSVAPEWSSHEWLAELQGVPLHMLFTLEKESSRQEDKLQPMIKDIVWSTSFDEQQYTMKLSDAVLNEFEGAWQILHEKGIDWKTLSRGDLNALPQIEALAKQIRHRLLEESGLLVLTGLDLVRLGKNLTERHEKAKMLYFLLSLEIGDVLERRGRLFDVMDKGLDIRKENVLFSLSNNESSFHTDSTDRDYNPDIVGLLCLQPAMEGGELQVVNGLNIYYNLKQKLHPAIMSELERPVIRDLIESGVGLDTSNLWETLRYHRSFNVQRRRLRNNAFPIFGRDKITGQFSFRYMRYWVESGHRRAAVPLSPMLQLAMDTLDHTMQQQSSSIGVQTMMKAGEMVWTNNHICAHNRTSFTSNPEGMHPRHLVRVWINFNPIWDA
jgi:Ca2+-binding EF-hand superfamily protein/2-polyprenyl-3-methyl-5-hydroxy-6-metoxy-1,4-benzoquinol methylase